MLKKGEMYLPNPLPRKYSTACGFQKDSRVNTAMHNIVVLIFMLYSIKHLHYSVIK